MTMPMKAPREPAGFDLLRLGRLAIAPVSDARWKAIIAMVSGAR